MAELPKIVAQRLRTTPSTAHPDADVITAFVEKSLSEREREQVLGHMAECHACREVMAFSFPQQQMTARKVPSVPPAWLTWPALRWGALAACVVVVGAAVTLHRESRPVPSVERSDSPTQLEQASSAKAMPAPVPAAQSAQPAASEPDLDAIAKRVEARDKESLGHVGAAVKTRAAVPMMNAPRPAVSAQTAPAVSDQASANSIAADQAEAVPGRAKDALQASAPAAATAGPGSARPSVSMAMSGMAMKKELAPIGLVPRWTLSADGTLQRSYDSGATWDTITVAGQSRFRALAADGLEIWVGGAKGALYHSSNAGQDWRQVQPASNGETLADDIIGVEFVDRLHGTVTTSGQEKWVTADAGQSWQKQ